MSSQSTSKQCDIFTRARKNTATTSKKPKPTSDAASVSTSDKPSNVSDTASVSTSDMANVTDVLNELKSLREDFGTKLDSIDTRLTGMANTMAALECKVTDVQRDVSSNATRIEEAESRIHEAEKALEKTEAALDSAVKRIAHLESKTEDLENRGRRKNLRLFGIREGAEGRQTLLDFVSENLPRWLNLDPEKPFTLERVHRTLASAKPNQNRAILIRFLKFQEKELVYRESRKRAITHDGAKITFAQDLSAETVRIRRAFNQVTQLFVDINAFRGFQHNPCRLRILHDSKIHLFSTPQEAERFYKSIPST